MEEPRRRRSNPIPAGSRHTGGFFSRRITVTLLILVVVLAIALGAVLVLNWGNHTQISSRTVKFGFENIGEMATQAGYFTNVQVVEGDRDIFGIVVPFTHKKYIYSYDGVIKAGIDFSKVQVSVDDLRKIIHVKLPDTAILSTEIDEDSLQIYDETNNAFNRLKLTDINQSLVALKEEIQKTAVEQGILQNATQNAQQLLRGFISNVYDLTVYTIAFDDAASMTQEEEAP